MKPSVSKLLDRFAAAEQNFLNQEFLAPVVPGSTVRVRIDGVVMQLEVVPNDFQGFAVFCPMTLRSAVFVRDATLAERTRYLSLMNQRTMILCDRVASRWLSLPAHEAAGEPSAAQIRLAENVNLFDTVRVGFDGTNYWFDRIDNRSDSAMAAWLRSSMASEVKPVDLKRKGLTSQQRAAYTLNYFARKELNEKLRRDEVESQIRAALGHAGAQFVQYVEHRDGFRVTYNVAGQQHVSSVNKKDLTVQSAGICLNGEDRKFDLASLVGVLREPDAQWA